MAAGLNFETLVARFYESLYQFAFSLTRTEADARDLVQQTFHIWAVKGHQLRDPAKVKTWLFTTLHREFLETRRKQTRFPHLELSQVEGDLPAISPPTINQMDAAQVLHSLAQIDKLFQAPLSLFYLEDYSYKEIADILDVPLGTVKSRIARGMVQLQQALTYQTAAVDRLKKDPRE